MINWIYVILVWIFMVLNFVTKGNWHYIFFGLEIGVFIGQLLYLRDTIVRSKL